MRLSPIDIKEVTIMYNRREPSVGDQVRSIELTKTKQQSCLEKTDFKFLKLLKTICTLFKRLWKPCIMQVYLKPYTFRHTGISISFMVWWTSTFFGVSSVASSIQNSRTVSCTRAYITNPCKIHFRLISQIDN